MPELLEVEYYRQLAVHALGRPIRSVAVPDRLVLRGDLTLAALRRALVGRSLAAARRRGKLLLLDTDGDGPTLGMRFGMTGGLVLDDRQAIEDLLYAPVGFGRQWVRFGLHFADGGALLLHDPRRFGRVVLDPDEDALGPDAATVTVAQLRGALATRPAAAGPAGHGRMESGRPASGRAEGGRPASRRGGGPALKARLLDQSRLAGLGNLLVDEVLWRAALSPCRLTGSLSDADVRRLAQNIRSTVAQLLRRGGSHTGDLMAERRTGGHCPKDGADLRRATVGGRTTWWCPRHQL
ncbi:MAG TPA: DNA-formamidopyrimidine glycosylase family protein [Acidimicrobiales bacterium]|nr:DNA-formamidopyrimidine glycosylase family protein [Acidimicrobiales bacterium]